MSVRVWVYRNETEINEGLQNYYRLIFDYLNNIYLF